MAPQALHYYFPDKKIVNYYWLQNLFIRLCVVILLVANGQFNIVKAEEILLCAPKGRVTLFTEDALITGKFDKKFVSSEPATPLMKPVVLGNCFTLNNGKDIVQEVFINRKRYAMFFPDKLSKKFESYGYSDYATYENGKRVSAPSFYWYIYNDYARLLNLKDSTIFYVNNGSINDNRFKAGRSYQITKIEFNRFNKEIIDLTLTYKDFHDSYNTIHLGLIPESYHESQKSNKGMKISDILKSFLPTSEYIEYCKNSYDQEKIDSIRNRYTDKEIYWNYLPYWPTKRIERGYWIFKGISLREIQNPDDEPAFAYFATLVSPDNKQQCFMHIPPEGRNDVLLATDYRNQLEEEYHKKEIRKLERQRKQQRWDDERNKSLTKKYGKVNAQYIMDGYVIIGWSEEMCIESWGYPNNISNVIKEGQNGEIWYYQNANLYFENNKLIMIQD